VIVRLIEKPFEAEALLHKLSDVLNSEPHAVALTP
jgi:hypothetical protein